jgi:hypothetical protein
LLMHYDAMIANGWLHSEAERTLRSISPKKPAYSRVAELDDGQLPKGLDAPVAAETAMPRLAAWRAFTSPSRIALVLAMFMAMRVAPVSR